MAEAAHLRRGRLAERLAVRYLEDRGLRKVAANFRCRLGELDLVMTDGRVLVVVEVRFRLDPRVVQPVETVTPGKQRRVIRATEFFLLRTPRYAAWPVRFDIVSVTGPADAPAVRWFRGAFTGDDVARS